MRTGGLVYCRRAGGRLPPPDKTFTGSATINSSFLIRLLLLCGCLAAWLGPGASSAQAFRVVIDAGHGGHDRGANVGRVFEKHLALDVARRLERYLKKRNVAVVMTRQNDTFVGLNDRVRIGERYGDAVFVSIHFNAAHNLDATGIETFYYNSQSQLLAGLVQFNVLQKVGAIDRGVKHRGFRVLRSKRPAILVEGGFLTNGGECRKCLSPVYRQKLAESIGYALVRYRKLR